MTIGAAGANAPGSGPSRRLAFAIVTMALFMSSVDVSIVATALPAIHASLRSSINWAGWTMTVYSLGNVIVLPIAGKFSDQFGRRRVFVVGVVIFTLASLACGFASDIYVLIACRALQSVGAATLQPSAAGIVADNFGHDRDRALGMFSTINSSGQIAGPVFGGLVVGYLSWRWIFFVNVPMGAVLLVMILHFIPESRRRRHARTDVRGLMLLATLILAANFGITNLGSAGAAVVDPGFLVPEGCALVLGWLFLRHSRDVEAPFIALRLLRGKGFAAVNCVNLLFGFAGFALSTLTPLYAQQRYHLSALSAGTLLTARGVGSIAVGALTAMALRRIGYRKPMVVGFVILAAATLLASVAPRFGMSAYSWLAVAGAIAGVAVGISNPASRNASMQLAPDDIAAITGLRQMFSYVGNIFSIAIITAILNRSTRPGITQAHIYWVGAAVLLAVMVPLVRRVPEHKGRW